MLIFIIYIIFNLRFNILFIFKHLNYFQQALISQNSTFPLTINRTCRLRSSLARISFIIRVLYNALSATKFYQLGRLKFERWMDRPRILGRERERRISSFTRQVKPLVRNPRPRPSVNVPPRFTLGNSCVA